MGNSILVCSFCGLDLNLSVNEIDIRCAESRRTLLYHLLKDLQLPHLILRICTIKTRSAFKPEQIHRMSHTQCTVNPTTPMPVSHNAQLLEFLFLNFDLL
jgi:hypothetical protein